MATYEQRPPDQVPPPRARMLLWCYRPALAPNPPPLLPSSVDQPTSFVSSFLPSSHPDLPLLRDPPFSLFTQRSFPPPPPSPFSPFPLPLLDPFSPLRLMFEEGGKGGRGLQSLIYRKRRRRKEEEEEEESSLCPHSTLPGNQD